MNDKPVLVGMTGQFWWEVGMNDRPVLVGMTGQC